MSTAAGHKMCDRNLKSQNISAPNHSLFCVLSDMTCSKTPAVKATLNHFLVAKDHGSVADMEISCRELFFMSGICFPVFDQRVASAQV